MRMPKKNPNWINPNFPVNSLTVGEAERRKIFLKSLKSCRDDGVISKESYDDIAELMLG